MDLWSTLTSPHPLEVGARMLRQHMRPAHLVAAARCIASVFRFGTIAATWNSSRAPEKPVPCRKLTFEHMVVEPAQNRHGERLTNRLDGARDRRVLLQ